MKKTRNKSQIVEQIKTPILDVIETSVKNPAYQFHIPDIHMAKVLIKNLKI